MALNAKGIDMNEKIKIKDEIKNYVINVRWHPNLEKDETELFYRGSNIYRTRYLYDFNQENKTGLGLVMKKIKNIGYFDE